jgi:hypothetical protein
MPIKWERTQAENLILLLYRQLFDRAPERDVLLGLTDYFAKGRVSVRMQLMRMLKSEEFFDKRLRHKTPEEIAGQLYRFILVRPPESAEALQGAADVVGHLGWQVEVDVMINCEEFLGRFGDDTPPPDLSDLASAPPPRQRSHDPNVTAQLSPVGLGGVNSSIHAAPSKSITAGNKR